MIKCPHCGSTAQVKLSCDLILSDNGEVVTEAGTCGCGCHFSVEYKRNNEGFWEAYWVSVDYIERKEK